MRPFFSLGLSLSVALTVPPVCEGQQPNKNLVHPTKGFRLIPVPAYVGGSSDVKSQVIHTQEQLDALVKQIKTQRGWRRPADFVKALHGAKLDFAKEALVVMHHEDVAGTRVGFAVPELIHDKLVCVICPNFPPGLTPLGADHCFALAVDKAQVSQVEVWVDDGDTSRLQHVLAVKPQPQKQEPPGTDAARRIAQLEVRVAELTKELEALRKGRKLVPVESKPVIMNFALKNRKAPDVAKILLDLFQDKDGTALRVAIDNQKNSVLVRCGREQMDEVEAVIHRLESAEE